jgi:hypothetical protein
MIVEFHLPQGRTGEPAEFKAGALFPSLHETQQVAFLGCSLEQDVDVIRHHAEGVDEE